MAQQYTEIIEGQYAGVRRCVYSWAVRDIYCNIAAHNTLLWIHDLALAGDECCRMTGSGEVGNSAVAVVAGIREDVKRDGCFCWEPVSSSDAQVFQLGKTLHPLEPLLSFLLAQLLSPQGLVVLKLL